MTFAELEQKSQTTERFGSQSRKVAKSAFWDSGRTVTRLAEASIPLIIDNPSFAVLPYPVQKQLIALARLQANWDGYGAASLSPAVFKNTRLFLTYLLLQRPKILRILSPDNIYPSPHGTLNIIWKNPHDDDYELSVEIGKQTCSYLIEFPDGRSEWQDHFEPDNEKALQAVCDAFEAMYR